MWKYEAVNDWDSISLHDCRITSIGEVDKDIILNFSDGYWIGEMNKNNAFKKTLSTGVACLTLINAHFTKIEIENEKITWIEFCSKINTDKWEFECITEKYYGDKCEYYGWVCFDDTPYHFDCCLEFSFDKIIYNWNDILETKPW